MTNAFYQQHEQSETGFIDVVARREFLLAWVIGLAYSTTQNYSALLAIVFEQSGHELASIGLLLSLFAIPTLSATLLSASCAARFGILPMARIAISLTAFGLASLALTRFDFFSALMSRLVQGAGVGFFLPVMMLYVQSRLTRARFVYLVTIFTATIPLASAIAPPLGEWTLAHWGANALFVQSLLPAVLALILTFFLRAPAQLPVTSGLDLAGGFKHAYLLPFLAVMIGGALYGYLVSYLPSHLQLRNIALAAFFMPSTLALLLGRFVAMRFLQHMRPPHVVALGMALSAFGYGVLALGEAWPAALIAGFMLGGGNSVMFPVVSAWVSLGLEPHQRAAPQALASTAFYFGIYVMPLPQTFLVAHFGYSGAEYVLGLVALGMMALLFLPLAGKASTQDQT